MVTPGIAAAQVKTTAGLVQGTAAADGRIRIFMGIPFAAPPVGEFRWQAPRPPAAWEGVRDATASSRCVQGQIFSDIVFTDKSEDCLNLNIWTPASRPGDRLPVMVWIHGGGFQAGAGAEPRHDGDAFARKGVVLVTFNYRLGVFGFFSHPELTRESSRQRVGQLRPARPGRGAAMGAGQHRGVRRQSRQRDDLRRVGRLVRGQRADGVAAGRADCFTRRSARAARTSRAARHLSLQPLAASRAARREVRRGARRRHRSRRCAPNG